jgi:2-(1,2-epoxy-1,2-dihydrophenyl)acetyl-CoA isomerase
MPRNRAIEPHLRSSGQGGMNLDENTLLVEKQDDGIAFLVINKPHRRNALDHEMMDQLVVTLEALESDGDVRVVVIKGQGKHFSSGADLRIVFETIEDVRMALRKYLRAVRTIQQMEKPVIAMVAGYAIGGGMSLALACDIIFASEDAKFSANFLQLGITPEMGAMLFMPLTIGLYRAKELWYTGRIVEAREAREMGFVNRVFPAEQLEEATKEFAREISRTPALPVRITKRITNSTIFSMLNTIMEAEVQSSPFCSQTAEHKAYIAAFVKKHTPSR